MDQPVFTKSYKLGSSYVVGFAPDGASLATINRNVTVWEAARHKRIASAHPFSHPSHFSFTPDGHQLVVKNTRGESVVLNASTLELVRDLGGYRLGEGTGPITVDKRSWSKAPGAGSSSLVRRPPMRSRSKSTTPIRWSPIS